MITEEGRTCTRCKEFKIWQEFNKRTGAPYGHQFNCRDCQKAQSHTYDRDMVKHRLAMRKYQEKLKRKREENDTTGNG